MVTTLYYIALLLWRVRKYDIIHIFCASYYSYSLSAIPALAIARLYGKKSILNYRSGEAEDHLENWRTAVPTIRWANEVVVPSGYLVDVFAQHGLRARAIHNIVELDRFTYRERQSVAADVSDEPSCSNRFTTCRVYCAHLQSFSSAILTPG